MSTYENSQMDLSNLDHDIKEIEIVDFYAQSPHFARRIAKPYFEEIYQDLKIRSTNSEKGINKLVLLQYIDLPGIIGDRFFSVLDQDQDGYLNKLEFVEGLLVFYKKNFSKKMKFVFDLYDFHRSEKISKEEIKLVLSHAPINKILAEVQSFQLNFSNQRSNLVQYSDRIQSLEELEKLTDECLQKKRHINFQEFTDICKNISCDMFLCLFCLIKMKLPSSEQFKCYKKYNKPQRSSSTLRAPSVLASPKMLTKFSSISSIIERTKSSCSLTQNSPSPNFLKKKFLSARKRESLSSFSSLATEVKREYQESKFLSSNVESEVTPPSSDFQESSSSSKWESMSNKNDDSCSACIKNNQINEYSGYLYMHTGEKKITRFWIKLINLDLYCYSNEDQCDHHYLWNLTGKFAKSQKMATIGSRQLYPFKIYSSRHDKRIYYCLTFEERKDWLDSLEKSLNQKNFSTHYQLQKILGKGTFATVYAAYNKKTQEEVAVKIIQKKKMKTPQLELIKKEIEVMRLCQHPNIIRLYETFETSKEIYLVMEKANGGDLNLYLKNRNYQLNEERIRVIFHSLATALFYLNSYGIVHRDIKPENILMVDDSDEAVTKLSDFGLSQILGPEEVCNEAYGTVAFVAPEVLKKEKYTKSVDLWSLGVVGYLMITGKLPFSGQNYKAIAKQVVNNEPDYGLSGFKLISVEAQMLIMKMLQKNPLKRISIDNLLCHPWIIQNNEKLYNLRIQAKKISHQRANSFRIYSSINPEESHLS